MSESLPYYTKDVTDARFDALRYEVRADIAGVRTEIANLRTELKGDIGTLDNKITALSAQMKVWTLGLGLVMPMFTLIVGKLWH